jgi:hypothetical protein
MSTWAQVKPRECFVEIGADERGWRRPAMRISTTSRLSRSQILQAAYSQCMPMVIEQTLCGQRALVTDVRVDAEDGHLSMCVQYPVEGPIVLHTSLRDVLRAMMGAERSLHVDEWKSFRVVGLCPARFGLNTIHVSDYLPTLEEVFPVDVRSGKTVNAGLVACAASYLPSSLLSSNKDLARKMVARAYNSGVSLSCHGRHLCDLVADVVPVATVT